MLNINPEDVLKNEKWLDIIEIKSTLEGVSHIVMAAPTNFEGKSETIHISLFLNTPDSLPPEIAGNVLEKFAFEYKITDIADVHNAQIDAGFAQTHQELPMPIPLEDTEGVSHVRMYLIDFTGKSELFPQAHAGMTGWSYIKNQ